MKLSCSHGTLSVRKVGRNRYRVQMDDFWELAYAWARGAGFPKEQGHYTGTPPI